MTPQNDETILVKGWSESEIDTIVADFIAMYENDGYPPYTIEPQKHSEDLYRLTFPQDIHPLLFMFLVNYLAYPSELDLTNRSIIVGGKTTLSRDFTQIDPQLVGKKAILYVPENDQDANVVYMQTESGDTLANSFSDMNWTRVNDARLSNEVKKLLEGN